MRKLSEKQLLILTIAVSVLLTGGLVALILGDKNEIEGIEGEISAIEQQIQVCDVEIAKTKNREDKVLVFRAVESRELAILPTAQKIADFLRNLSTFFAAAGIDFSQAPESSPNESELAKGINETRTKLTLAGDAPAILRFMNMVENDPRLVAIKGFTLSAGQKDRMDPNKPILHDVNMTLATYFYDPAAGGVKRVHIPNEQKRLQDPKIQAAIDSFEPERPDTYVLRPSASRRDPFVDPRVERQTEPDDIVAERLKRESGIVEDLESQQREIAELIEQEKALISAGDLFRADRLGQEIDEKINELRAELAKVIEMKEVTVASLTARVQEVVIWLDSISGRRPQRDVTVTRKVAEKLLAELEELFNGGDYTELQNQANAWDGYVRGKEVDPGARSVLARINAMRRRAKNLSDFAALQLIVKAVIISEDDPRRNVALISGSAHRAGDKLDESGELVVGRISKTNVEFKFREERISLPVGRAGIASVGEKRAGAPRPLAGGRAPAVPIGSK
ncbi:MAG: hypothetical protein QNJ98_04050 [Planctomycetota bacterium]|nr:hypothetical protein [Planctomycetota bacterium]